MSVVTQLTLEKGIAIINSLRNLVIIEMMLITRNAIRRMQDLYRKAEMSKLDFDFGRFFAVPLKSPFQKVWRKSLIHYGTTALCLSVK